MPVTDRATPTPLLPPGAAWRVGVPWVIGLVAMWRASPRTGDWQFFTDRAADMFGSSGLDVYAQHPKIQSGPLHLVVVRSIAWLGPSALTIAVALLGLVTLCAIDRLAGIERSPQPAGDDRGGDRRAITGPAWTTASIVGGGVLMAWWPYLKVMGHLDDAMVITIGVVALCLVRGERRAAAAVLIGLGLLIKPWIVMLVPLVWVPEQRLRGGRYVGLVLLVAGIGWAPFLLADPSGTLLGIRPQVWPPPDGILRFLADRPTESSLAAIRTLQLLAAAGFVGVTVWRRRWPAALLAGAAVRVLLDPGTWNYYTVAIVAGALVWDLRRDGPRVPVLTLAMTVLIPPSWVLRSEPELRAVLRLAGCWIAVVVVVVACGRRRRHAEHPTASAVPGTIDAPALV